VSLAASGRFGNEIRMSIGDTLISTAHIPDHYAASVGFTGIPGTFVAARYGVDRWKSMEPLSTVGAPAVETSDLSVGLESSGPRTGTQAVIFRLGARFRTLPFQVGDVTVKERSFSGGAGLPLGKGRAVLDLAVSRSSRTGVTGVTESAFNLSFGLRVHP
jgi:hypothetical protein